MTIARTFFERYIAATNTHDFETVRPCVDAAATYWFGERHFHGHDAIAGAFASAWGAVQDEVYSVSECSWLVETPAHAVVTYRYSWTGLVGGVVRSGAGYGTNVLARRGPAWLVLHEHLTLLPG